MARTGFFHHIGTFLLLAATVLLIVVDISAPVVNNISLLRVELANGGAGRESTVSFGTFGHCILDAAPGGQDICSPSVVGYRPTDVMFEADGTQFEDYQEVVTFRLTRVMILHPVATGICFIAFLVSIGAGIVGSFLASLLAALAFLTTLLVLICDFVLWGIIKLEVDRNSAGSDAEFGVAIWCVLAAGICAFLAAIILFFSCCSARLRRRRDAARDAPKGDEKAAPTRKFWWNRSKA